MYNYMTYGGQLPQKKKGGAIEPNGEMALGQMAAVQDKMNKLLQFVKPDDNLDPWIASKLAVMDHSADTIADYMMYGPDAAEEGMEEMGEMRDGGGIPDRYKNKGFTKVGVKRQSNRPGKKWMVLAKKGDDYKVVHGGYKGMKDYTQHGNAQRRENFWNRMGGKNSAKAKDPFSPLYWHKRFGTWQDGGLVEYEGGDFVPYDVKAGEDRIFGKFTGSTPSLGYTPMGLPVMSIQDKLRFGMPTYASDYDSYEQWEASGMPQLSKKDLSFPGLQKPLRPKSPTGKDYNYIGAGLINMGLNAVGGIAQQISNNKNIKNDTSDSLFPSVANTYSRGRNEINTGRYADDSLVPVQFAGTPVSEYYGAPLYREMGGSFEVSSGILGLPKMMDDASMYIEPQLEFNMPMIGPSAEGYSSPAGNPAPVKGKGSMAARHNNPGNIHYGSFAKNYGAASGDEDNGGKVAIFPDAQTGLKAFSDLLFGPGYNNLTVEQARNRWVNGDAAQPTSSSKAIVKAMGGNRKLNTLNSEERQKLIAEFAKWEDRVYYDQLKKQKLFEEGGEYELDADQIQQILENGGQVEYL